MTLEVKHTHDERKDYYAMQIKRRLERLADMYEDYEITDDGGTHWLSVKDLINDIGTAIEAALNTEDNFIGVDKYHQDTGCCFDCIGPDKNIVKGDFGDCATCVRNLR